MYSIVGAFTRDDWEKYETTKFGKILSVHTCGMLEYCEGEIVERGLERYDYMLVYIIKGGVFVEINEKSFPLNVGDVAIFPPHTPYKIYRDSYCEWYWVHFGTNLPLSDFSIPDVDKISVGESRILGNEFLRLMEECNNVDHNTHEICTCLCMGILFNIGRMYKRAENDVRFSDTIDYAIKAMTVNEVSRGYIKEYAAIAGCSEIKFREECKKRTGMTPKQYVLHKRKLRIAGELGSCGCSLQEYAVSLGFREYSYFCRFVKKHLGMSPENYIKAIYSKNGTDKYNVTATDGEEVYEALHQFDARLTVAASGDGFSYWKDTLNDAAISDSAIYTFYVPGDISIETVYNDNDRRTKAVTLNSAVQKQKRTDGEYNLYFTGNITLSEGAELTAVGITYTNTEASAGLLETLEEDAVNSIAVNSYSENLKSGPVMVILSAVKPSRQRYAKLYITYVLNGENHTVFSDCTAACSTAE